MKTTTKIVDTNESLTADAPAGMVFASTGTHSVVACYADSMLYECMTAKDARKLARADLMKDIQAGFVLCEDTSCEFCNE